jgi:hypothetical protein
MDAEQHHATGPSTADAPSSGATPADATPAAGTPAAATAAAAKPESGPAGDRRRAEVARGRRRIPTLIAAAGLVAAGLLLALLGMRQVIARIPATPVPSPVAGQSPGAAPPSSTQAPRLTATPTPAQTPSPLIYFP